MICVLSKKDVPMEIPWVPKEGLFQRRWERDGGGRQATQLAGLGGWGTSRRKPRSIHHFPEPPEAWGCGGPFDFLFTGSFLALSKALMMMVSFPVLRQYVWKWRA